MALWLYYVRGKVVTRAFEQTRYVDLLSQALLWGRLDSDSTLN